MPKKILVIDDSLTVRKFIERALAARSAEYTVTTANSGSEGLELAHAMVPDLILLDYVLPDIRGDAVCGDLLQNPRTAHVPVILMSSSGDEIKKVRALYANAVNAVTKPFTPELLTATVAYVFHTLPESKDSFLAARRHLPNKAAASASICLRGHTGFFSLTDALRTIEKDRLSGVLRAHMGQSAIEAYVRNGHIEVVTTRDPKLYLRESSFEFVSSRGNVWAACEKGQKDSGCPLFILMVERGLIPRQMMIPLVEIHGHRLFSRLWTAGQVSFEFENLSSLPSYVGSLAAPEIMDNWILKTTRYVGAACLPALGLGEATGTPGFTRTGYEEIIQRVNLNQEETDFAFYVNGVNSLQDIVKVVRLPSDSVTQILFRFICLGVMEYWPMSTLQSRSSPAA